MDDRDKARFFARVKRAEQCWLWLGPPNGSGYGQFRLAGKTYGVHVISWRLHRGEVPRGMRVLHSCDVRLCVNPEHLWLGTQRDNLIDRSRKGHVPHAKTTLEQVREIRANPLERQGSLAKRLGLHPWVVHQIRAGAAYAWV